MTSTASLVETAENIQSFLRNWIAHMLIPSNKLLGYYQPVPTGLKSRFSDRHPDWDYFETLALQSEL